MLAHKLLRGAQAGLYLPFALSRLRALHALSPNGSLAQRFRIGGYDILVRQTGPFQYISIIESGGSFFEFFTNGWPATTTSVSSEFGTFDYTDTMVVDTTIVDGKVSPIISLGKRNTSTHDASAINRGNQVQLIDEPVTYFPIKDGKYREMLFESWAPMHSHTGVHIRNFCHFYDTQDLGASLGAHADRDVDYDVPYSDGYGKTPTRDAYLRGTTDWPRASGKYTHTANDGTKTVFAIYIDASSQFSAFPVSKIGPVSGFSQNVDALYVQTAAPSFPAWCHLPAMQFKDYWAAHPGDLGLVSQPELDWKVNHLGTKACAVVYERATADYDSTYFGAYTAGAHPMTLGQFNTIRDSAGLFKGYGNASPTQRYNLAPGLVEAAINISITGPNPQDFTIDVTISEVRRPTTSKYCPVVAGYPWFSIKNDAGNEIAAPGDLCSLDLERYYCSDEHSVPYQRADANSTDTLTATTIFSLKNITAGTEMRTFNASRTYSIFTKKGSATTVPNDAGTYVSTVRSRLMNFDLPTMSFMFQNIYVQGGADRPTTNFRDGGSPNADQGQPKYYCGHPSVAVYTLGKLRKLIFPDTIDDASKAVLSAEVTRNVRASVTSGTAADISYSSEINPDVHPSPNQWVLVPLNDNPPWSGTGSQTYPDDVGNLTFDRDQDMMRWRGTISINSGYFATGAGVPGDTSAGSFASATSSGWRSACGYNANIVAQIYVTDPRMGWSLYSDLLCSHLYKKAYGAFFAHPDGSWALFDQSIVYDRNGTLNPGEWYFTRAFDTLTPYDASKLEHFIVDSIHLNNGGSPVDTSFLELYNKAVVAGIAAGSLDSMQVFTNPLTKAMLQIAFVKQTFTPGDGSTWLQIKLTRPNGTADQHGYLIDPYVGRGAIITPTFGSYLSSLTLDQNAFSTLPDFGGNFSDFESLGSPVRFCDPLLIEAT